MSGCPYCPYCKGDGILWDSYMGNVKGASRPCGCTLEGELNICDCIDHIAMRAVDALSRGPAVSFRRLEDPPLLGPGVPIGLFSTVDFSK